MGKVKVNGKETDGTYEVKASLITVHGKIGDGNSHHALSNFANSQALLNADTS